MKQYSVRTSTRIEFQDITGLVRKEVKESGVKEGICVVYVPHTTAGVTINENADPAVAQTIANAVAKLAPDEIKRVVKAGSVEVIDYAKLPVKADWPVARNTAIGALVGLFAAILVAVVSAMLDSVIRTEEDLPDELGVPIIGVIPSMNGSARKGGY